MLIDAYGRKIDYLRISVTDRCNLRCVYCMPVSGILHKPQDQILSFEDIYRVVNVAVGLGIHKVRITGGEPLVRKDLIVLIKKLKTILGLKELSLTTNGIYLTDYAPALKIAGLDRVNISLDSLNPEKFGKITRGGKIDSVFKGIKSALLVGLAPIKINIVLIKGFNEDEIANFMLLTKDKPLHIRFIEYMPTGLNYIFGEDIFFSCVKAKEICQGLGKLIPVGGGLEGTARVFAIKGFSGTVGFISPLSLPFCSSCNKLRLTSDGLLKSCLHSSKSVDLKEALVKGIDEAGIATLIKEAVSLKPKSHSLLNDQLGYESKNFSMCQIGG